MISSYLITSAMSLFPNKVTLKNSGLRFQHMNLERHNSMHNNVPHCCRKADPFQGPKLGSCLTLGNELSKETHLLTKQEIIGKGRPGGEQWGTGSQENCSAAWLAVSGFMVMGLVSGWSLANQSNSESFLVVHASLSQDGC